MPEDLCKYQAQLPSAKSATPITSALKLTRMNAGLMLTVMDYAAQWSANDSEMNENQNGSAKKMHLNV